MTIPSTSYFNDTGCINQSMQFVSTTSITNQSNTKIFSDLSKQKEKSKIMTNKQSKYKSNHSHRMTGLAFSIIAKVILLFTIFIIVKYYFFKQPEYEIQGIFGLCLSSIRWFSGFTRKEIQLADGYVIPYLEGGSNKHFDTNNVLVLIHGFGKIEHHIIISSRLLL